MNKPNGIVLVTGPTGSAKPPRSTRPLRTERHRRQDHHTEDPVEYDIEASYSAHRLPHRRHVRRCLRAILRKTPTLSWSAKFAISKRPKSPFRPRSPATWCLHAAHQRRPEHRHAVARHGHSPFLITATVEGILAQRLVRRVCSACREAIVPSSEMLSDWNYRRPICRPHVLSRRGCDTLQQQRIQGSRRTVRADDHERRPRDMVMRAPRATKTPR